MCYYISQHIYDKVYALQVGLQIQSTNSSAAIARNETAKAAAAVETALANVCTAL